MSRAFYKPSAAPRLLRAFPSPVVHQGTPPPPPRIPPTKWPSPSPSPSSPPPPPPSIEVWNTTCVVTNFGRRRLPNGGGCRVLINPANPQLSGVSKFPYFPRGGPVPKEYPKVEAHHIMGYVTQWGGMEVGDGMLFASNVVDGIVHRLGGWSLALEIKLLPILGGGDERCPVGRAVATSAGWRSELSEEYDAVVHAVPPFYRHHPGGGDPEEALAGCYHEALSLAFARAKAAAGAEADRHGGGGEGEGDDGTALRVASPLLGAGCRSFPLEAAARVAAKEGVRWRDGATAEGGEVLAFGVPDAGIAEELVGAIERAEGSVELAEESSGGDGGRECSVSQ